MARTRQRPKRREAPAPDTRQPAAASRSLVALVVVTTVVAATLERLWRSAAWGESASLTSAFYFGDATRFVDYAHAIVQGRPFDNGIPFHPPGWPLALAALTELSGSAQVPVPVVKLLLAAVSGLGVGLAALLAYEMAGGGAMLAVAFLGTFNFGHMVEGGVANSEALYGLLAIAAVFAVWRWLGGTARRPLAWAAAAGALGGCAMLVRAEFLACAVLFLVLAWRAGVFRQARGTQAIAAFVIACGLVLVPTTVWHWNSISAFNTTRRDRVAGPLPRFAPVTSYGPFNFAMASHEYADGGPNRDHPMLDQCDPTAETRLDAGELDLACPAVYDLYVNGYVIGMKWLLTHPGDAIALMANKAGMAIGFLAHGYFIDGVGAGVEGTRRRVDLVDPASRGLLPLHLLLIAAGCYTLRGRTVALGVIAAPIGALMASTLLFYGYVRLGVAYLPVVWILQGAGVALAAHRLTGLRAEHRRVIAAALGAIVALTAIEGIRSRSDRAVVLDGLRTPSGALVEDETLTVRRVPRP